MSTKNKIIISVTTVCIVAIIAVAVVVAVVAASAHTFSTSIRVTYSSTQVSGSAKACYYIGEAQTKMFKNGDGETEELTFDVEDPATSDTLKPVSSDAIPLSDVNRFIVFEYEFTNKIANPYQATLSYTDTGIKDKGFTVTYLDSASKLNKEQYGTINKTFAIGETSTKTTVVTANVGAATGDGDLTPTTRYVYIKIEISNLDVSAEFSGDFEWNLVGQAE